MGPKLWSINLHALIRLLTIINALIIITIVMDQVSKYNDCDCACVEAGQQCVYLSDNKLVFIQKPIPVNSVTATGTV